ncbi:MAG TPA: hypothetical protein H9830_05110 [Candidatus Agrococcus pullicola]|uniref:Uncharacterized protein n=1 Tax=Candidatus Agrococcus pullicola TaxID=2838429 RepID=A0A9D1YTQ7_9MICO|nr:hypothetical protein [Candidatus Agrococcus pullicola]
MATESTAPLLRVTGLLKAFPGLTALDRVDLDVGPGEIVSVVGHNGSRKVNAHQDPRGRVLRGCGAR